MEVKKALNVHAQICIMAYFKKVICKVFQSKCYDDENVMQLNLTLHNTIILLVILSSFSLTLFIRWLSSLENKKKSVLSYL